MPGPPPPIVALDHESPVDAYRDPVVAQLVRTAARGESVVTTATIAESVMTNYAIYGRGADPRGAPQQWQAMQRAARGQGRRKKPAVPAGQLTFDLWALAQDLDAEDSDP